MDKLVCEHKVSLGVKVNNTIFIHIAELSVALGSLNIRDLS